MPVKRRLAKRRVNPEREYQIWNMILIAGYDFFDTLVELGVEKDEYGRPDRVAARTAWERFGARTLAEIHPDMKTPWAQREFGRPRD